MKKTLLLFFAAFCLQQTNAQVTPTPFDLSTQNGIPVYINAISHDTAWGGVVGMNSGTWVNLKTYGRTVDAGTTWNTDTIPDAIDRGIVDFFALDGNKAWAVMGDFNGVNPVALWKTINAGATWTLTTELDSVLAAGFFLNSIYFFSADSGIAMGDPRNGYAEVYNTSDGGTSWTRVPQVNMPASVAGEGGVIHGYAAEGDKIWFNTNKGKIYYSYDRGYTWSVSVVSSVNYYFGMAFNDSIHGVAFRDQNSSLSNEIFVTSNGGVTWTQQALSPPIILLQATGIKNIQGTFLFTAGITPRLCATTDNFLTWSVIDSLHSYPANADFASPIKMFDASFGWAAAAPLSDSAIYKLENVLTGIQVLNDASNVKSFNIFPNPVTSGAVFVSFALKKNTAVIISLLDITGKIICQQTKQGVKGENALIFNLSDVSGGMYILNLQAEKESIHMKVVVN